MSDVIYRREDWRIGKALGAFARFEEYICGEMLGVCNGRDSSLAGYGGRILFMPIEFWFSFFEFVSLPGLELLKTSVSG